MAGWLSALSEDVGQAVRGLRRHPGVAAAVVALLGVGVGVSTVAFGTVYGLLLRPLPWGAADRIVRIEIPRGGQPGRRPLYRRQFLALEEAAESFSQVAAWAPRALAWAGPDGPEELHGASVSRSLLPLLKGTLHLGRSLAEAGDRDDVVLLSHRTWLRRFGGDPAVVGMVLALGARRYAVAGVLSEGVDFPGPETEFWIPMVFHSSVPGLDRVLLPVSTVGRLKPGVSADRAQTEVRAILRRQFGDRLSASVVRVFPLREALYGVYRPALSVLAAAAGALLLLVGASVTGLLLVRLSGRRRDLTLRGVLGAAPGRVARGLLVESVVLSAAGGAVGLAAAAILQRVVGALVPAAAAHLAAGAGAAPVVAFGTAAGVGLVCGAAPVLSWLRGEFRPLPAAGAQGFGGAGLPGANRARAALVVAQVAAALALLVAAGLLLRSFARFVAVDPGHEAGTVLTARVGSPDLPDMFLDGITPEQGGARFVAVDAFHDSLAQGLPGLEAMREVEAVGLSSTLPFTEARRGATFRVVGGGAADDPERLPWAPRQTLASPGYFEVLRPRLRAGRLFDGRDTVGSPRAAVVNETFARTFLPAAAVGSRLVLTPDTLIPRPVDVVGVVADFEVPGGAGASPPEIFLSTSQLDYGWPDEMFVSVRTAGDPGIVLPFLRRELAEVAPRAVLKDVRTMRDRRSEAVAEPRFYAVAAGSIAAFALVLAACSLYGVLSYSVWQRRREFGVRLALGAQRGHVFGLVLRQGAALVAAGVVLGLAAGAAAARLLESLLFGVGPMDVPTAAAAAAVLAAVAAAAGYVPARRAVSVAPLDVLRCE